MFENCRLLCTSQIFLGIFDKYFKLQLILLRHNFLLDICFQRAAFRTVSIALFLVSAKKWNEGKREVSDAPTACCTSVAEVTQHTCTASKSKSNCQAFGSAWFKGCKFDFYFGAVYITSEWVNFFSCRTTWPKIMFRFKIASFSAGSGKFMYADLK